MRVSLKMEEHTDVLIGYPETGRSSSSILVKSNASSLEKLDDYYCNEPSIQKQLETIEVVPEVQYDAKGARDSRR